MIRFIYAIILVFILSAEANAAGTLTFQDNSTNETSWVVYLMKADNTQSIFLTFPSSTQAILGQVTITIPAAVPGDCVTVAASNQSGVSGWSNRGCITSPSGAVPASPVTAVLK